VIQFLVDQNFNEHIVDALTRRDEQLVFFHVRDIGLAASADLVVLQWAASHDLVVLTHDRQTMPSFAYTRVKDNLPMPGVFLVSDAMPIGQAIDELLTKPSHLFPALADLC
jgi:hypothetical protein